MQMTNMATSEPVIAVRDDAMAGAIELEGGREQGWFAAVMLLLLLLLLVGRNRTE